MTGRDAIPTKGTCSVDIGSRRIAYKWMLQGGSIEVSSSVRHSTDKPTGSLALTFTSCVKWVKEAVQAAQQTNASSGSDAAWQGLLTQFQAWGAEVSPYIHAPAKGSSSSSGGPEAPAKG
eukprot:2093957-Amphidinium_carterae.1